MAVDCITGRLLLLYLQKVYNIQTTHRKANGHETMGKCTQSTGILESNVVESDFKYEFY